MRLADELERLHDLLNKGAMTEDEYLEAKARLLEGGVPPAEAKGNPAPFAWEDLAEPQGGEAPRRTHEVSEKDALRALEAGAIGGAILGLAWSFAGGIALWPSVIGAALAGMVVWTVLSLGVQTTARSRGWGVSLLRLVYAAAIASYGLALLVLLGFAIHVKSHQGQPVHKPYVPPAKVN